MTFREWRAFLGGHGRLENPTEAEKAAGRRGVEFGERLGVKPPFSWVNAAIDGWYRFRQRLADWIEP